jgi:hypothetical protein
MLDVGLLHDVRDVVVALTPSILFKLVQEARACQAHGYLVLWKYRFWSLWWSDGKLSGGI